MNEPHLQRGSIVHSFNQLLLQTSYIPDLILIVTHIHTTLCEGLVWCGGGLGSVKTEGYGVSVLRSPQALGPACDP